MLQDGSSSYQRVQRNIQTFARYNNIDVYFLIVARQNNSAVAYSKHVNYGDHRKISRAYYVLYAYACTIQDPVGFLFWIYPGKSWNVKQDMAASYPSAPYQVCHTQSLPSILHKYKALTSVLYLTVSYAPWRVVSIYDQIESQSFSPSYTISPWNTHMTLSDLYVVGASTSKFNLNRPH